MWPTLYQLTQLRSLDLSHTGLSHCDVPCLVSSLQQLTYLDLSYSGMSSITKEVLQSLRGLPHLQELRLLGCSINAKKLQEVAQLPCTTLSLVFQDDAEVLRDLLSQGWVEKLVELDLGHSTRFWPRPVEASMMIQPLSRLTGLRSFSVNFPCCADILAGLTSLSVLKLQVVKFDNGGVFLKELSVLTGLQDLTVYSVEPAQSEVAERAYQRHLEGWLPQLTSLSVCCL